MQAYLSFPVILSFTKMSRFSTPKLLPNTPYSTSFIYSPTLNNLFITWGIVFLLGCLYISLSAWILSNTSVNFSESPIYSSTCLLNSALASSVSAKTKTVGLIILNKIDNKDTINITFLFHVVFITLEPSFLILLTITNIN